MSAFKQRVAKAGVSVALLATVTAAMLAVFGVGAGSAFAAECTGGTLTGKGSTLQTVAQTEIWIPHTCSKGSTAKTPVYDNGGSGSALKAWTYNESASETERTTYAFVGTDDAPSEAQLKRGNEKAGAGVGTAVVPVAQTAIAVVVHPPEKCTLTQITNVHLEEAFSGKATTWTGIGATGEGCSGTLTRVVRKEGSGTTFQFKNYLAKIKGWDPTKTTVAEKEEKEVIPCTGATKWSTTEEIGAGEEPNIKWPKCGTMEPETAAGGGAVAETVKNMAGTIGYAALPDAKAKGAQVVEVQDNGTGTTKVLYAKPGSKAGKPGEEEPAEGFANCEKAQYVLPTNAETNGLNKDWSQVFGGNPSISGETYPICTLTYDLGWHGYTTAGYGAGTAESVKNYLSTIVTEGTLTTVKKWYAALPTLAGKNVKVAAEKAVEQITS